MESFKELTIYFLYMAISTTFIPLPTEPYPIYMGENYSPNLVAFLGALGASISNFGEYHLVLYFFRRGKLKRLKEHRHLVNLEKKVKDKIFLSLLICSSTGIIPSDAVRLLAMVTHYNPWLASLAIFIGRFPRYFFWAFLGMKYQFPLRYILAFYFLLLLVLLFHMVRKHRILTV